MPEIVLGSGRRRDRLHFIDENNTGRQPVLLIHGLGATCDSWQLQIPELVRAGYRVIAADIPGFGGSTCTGGRWSVRRAAGSLADLAHQLEIQSFRVVGISMGGALALRLCLDYPGLVEKLVLVNTFARLRTRQWRTRYYFLKRFFLVLGSDFHSQAGFVAQRIFPGADQEILRSELIRQITMADVRIYRSAMLSLAFFNAEKRLTSIQTPTLVITGATDTTVDPQLQARLARGIPGAIHVVIPGAGHAVTADHPQVFNQVLLKFLEGGNLTGPEGCPFETGGLDQNISPSS